MIDAFDADVLILSATGDPRGRNIRRIMRESDDPIGSLILFPEVLAKPIRLGHAQELDLLTDLVARLSLKAMDLELAQTATAFAVEYSLRAADSIHLATAVIHGANRFHTNNRKNFGPHIEEVEVVWP